MTGFEDRFEDHAVALSLMYVDPFRKHKEKGEELYEWYKSELKPYGLCLSSITSRGINVYPKGCRTRSPEGEFVVPSGHIDLLSWGLVRVFLGYPEGLEP